jgi:hypothetical protein
MARGSLVRAAVVRDRRGEQQQLLDHVQGQQRLHAVKRDALPEFRAGEIEKPARVTEDVFIVHGGRGKPSRMRRQRCDDFGTRRQR